MPVLGGSKQYNRKIVHGASASTQEPPSPATTHVAVEASAHTPTPPAHAPPQGPSASATEQVAAQASTPNQAPPAPTTEQVAVEAHVPNQPASAPATRARPAPATQERPATATTPVPTVRFRSSKAPQYYLDIYSDTFDHPSVKLIWEVITQTWRAPHKTWGTIQRSVKENWYENWKKAVIIHPDDTHREPEIRAIWFKKAAERFRDDLRRAVNKQKEYGDHCPNPLWCNPLDWQEILAYRNSSRFFRKSNAGKQNRANVRAVSTSGSKCHEKCRNEMEDATQEKVPPEVLYTKTHRVSDHARQVLARYNEAYQTICTQNQASENSQPIDLYQLWVDTIGAHGLGNIASQYGRKRRRDGVAASSQSSQTHSTQASRTPQELLGMIESLEKVVGDIFADFRGFRRDLRSLSTTVLGLVRQLGPNDDLSPELAHAQTHVEGSFNDLLRQVMATTGPLDTATTGPLDTSGLPHFEDLGHP